MAEKEITIPLNRTSILTVLLIVAALAIGALWTEVRFLRKGGSGSGNNAAAAPGGNEAGSGDTLLGSADDVEGLRDIDHIKGNSDAKILLIEYSDFECPFCKQFHPTAQQAVDEYDGDVAWVYRHFPLSAIHQKAMTEAIAAECAYELGGNDAFWKFTDRIFEVTPSNDGLDLDTLPDIARFAGVDVAQFQTCLDEEQTLAHVEEDTASGAAAGVTGTPGNILLNTETGETLLIPGAVPYQQIQQGIDQLLAG